MSPSSFGVLLFTVGSELARAVFRSASKLAGLRNSGFLGMPFGAIGGGGLLAMAIAPFALAASQPDLVPAAKRAATVELAGKIARQHDPVPLQADYPHPYNPPGFDQRDPEEEKAKTAAAQVVTEAAKPTGDRQILETIAPRVTPDGTALLPRTGEPVLFFRQKKLKVGDHLTITFDGHDYEVEITAIDRTTFTMRLNSAEITRPIQPGKSP